MKRVSDLYGRHPGSDIYVVGTGPSMRVFPYSFFDDKITIGLNLAWKIVPVTYGITIHADINIPEFMEGEFPHPEITWITGHHKAKTLLKPQYHRHLADHVYDFEYWGQPNTQPEHEPHDTGRILEWVRRPTGAFLYTWSSISQTGANLAANLGARNVILVGCDSSSLLGNHHAHLQHTRWKGVDPDHRYRQYVEGLAEVRAALRERGVNLVSLTPFVGLDALDMDFRRLCGELGKPELIRGQDISPPGMPLGGKVHQLLRGARNRVRRLARR